MDTLSATVVDPARVSSTRSGPAGSFVEWGLGRILLDRRGGGSGPPQNDWSPPAVTRPERIAILAVDDDADDAEILRRNLDRLGGFTFEFTHVPGAEDAYSGLAAINPDLVFLDYCLGSVSGLDVLREIRSSGFRGPVVVVTGRGDQHVVADLIRAGADDYVVKADLCPLLLERAINNAMRLHWRRVLEAQNRELVIELQAAREALEGKNRRLAELYELAHRFVADVSHDFRTPLTVIKEFAEILLDGLAGGLTAEQREYIGYISERTDDLSVMVTDLLDLSHNDAGLLRIVRVERAPLEIVERALRALQRKAAAAQVGLELDVPRDLSAVYCDAERIGRVLINLTINALKYSPPGGRVRVWARCDEDPTLVRMGVTDEGPGIAPEDQATLFDRFRQVQSEGRTVRQGFGLGLSIARELVLLNLGEIGVESRLSEGSTFWFTLPKCRPEAVARQFLRYLERSNPGRAAATLLSAWVDADAQPCGADELEVFLQNTLRCRDVPVRMSPRKWVLMAGTDCDGVAGLIDRIDSARVEANRNRPSSPLPSLHFEILGVWHSGASAETFEARVASAAATGETDHH